MALIDAKFQPWAAVKDQLQSILQTADPQDMCVTIPYGLQLLHSLRHPHVVRCLAFYHTTAGDIYVTHIDTGACNEIYVWTVSSLDEHEVKCFKFPIKAAISRLIFIPHHRVFVGFCSDMTLRTFSDLIHQCAELTQVTCLSTVLCMVYNEYKDELITGGHGHLQTWKMTHIELRDPPTPGRPIHCQISPEDWVRDLQIDRKQRQLVVLCDEGVCIIDYLTNRQTLFIRNWHETALTSCVFYRRLEYFITAAMDGSIKVWNAVVYSQVHEFIGHYDCVTGLVIHPTDPLLISSSKDGTIRVWRLDTFELTQRLDVGEKILAMRLANHSQLFYYTLHDVKVYTFNQSHHMFTPVQSCIHKLALVAQSKGPSRILCAAEDGGVRLISGVSGTILTIIYPMATYQVLTDLVYDPSHGMIYTVMATGDVLVFNSTSNPCTADQLWVPNQADECVLCLTIIKLDYALGKPESGSCKSLIFAGLNSGQIILLEADSHFMKAPVQAHIGQVTALECSHGWCPGGDDGKDSVGSADRLVSCGSDKIVRVWGIGLAGPKNLKVKLTCRKMITCLLCPSHVSMLGNSLCMVLPNNVIHVCEILEDARGSNAQDQEAGRKTKKQSGVTLHTHIKEHNHTKTVTALCSCQSLNLFATTSADGSVKIWDLTNTLVRELCFDSTLRSVCFANDRGDLLIGFQNHISYVSISTYLPLFYMERILEKEFGDQAVEEPIPFNPDLQLWFSISSLPTFPTDVVLRRRMQQSMDHLQRHRRSIAPPRDRGDSEAAPSPVNSSSTTSAAVQQLLPAAPSLDEVGRHGRPKPHVRFSSPNLIATPPAKQPPHEGAVSPHPPPKEQELVAETPPIAGDAAPCRVEEEGEAVSGDKEDAEDGLEEAELQEIKEEEEEDYNPWPIAPDGYIPNSVIRSVMGYHQMLEPIPESAWKLKSVPSMYEVAKTPHETDSYERHEPFIWAPSSEEEEEEDLSLLSLASLQDEASQTRVLEQLGLAHASAAERRKTLEMLNTSGMALPGKLSIPQMKAIVSGTKGKGRKRRRKSKGINAAGMAVVRQKMKASESMTPDESEEEEEVIGDAVPELLRRIATNDWFPRGVTLRVEPVVRTLLSLLDEVADLKYRPVCEALVEIYKQLGITDHLMETVLEVYRGQLKSGKAIVRANAVKTLTAFGLDRRDVILSLLPALADDAADVREETVRAVDALAGIQDRNGLMDYLEKIGFLRQYHTQEKEVIQELARRCTPDPSGRTSLRLSRIRLVAHPPRDAHPPLSPIDGIPCISPDIGVQNWLGRYQVELAQCADDDDIFPAEDMDMEPGYESFEALMMKRPAARAPFPAQRGRIRAPLHQPPGTRRATSKYGVAESPAPPSRRIARCLVGALSHTGASARQRASEGVLQQPPASTQRRNTLHAEILQAHDKSLALEKVRMESHMQRVLHHHRERYERLKRQQDPWRGGAKESGLVPSRAGLYAYYERRAEMEAASSEEEDWYGTESSEWSQTALARVRAVVAAFAEMPSQLRRPAPDYSSLPSESGVGGSRSLFGSGLQRAEEHRGRGRMGPEVEGSSGFITETNLLDPCERPKSKLTVENLQRHDALSGKAKLCMDEGTVSTRTAVSHQTQKNWRQFFSLPSVERRKAARAAGLSHNAPAGRSRPIRCIPAEVKVDRSRAERGQRILEGVVAVGGRRAGPGAGLGGVFCSPVPEKLTVNTKNRHFGTSHYGNVDMTWTTDGPITALADQGRHHRVISMTTVSPSHPKDSHQRCRRQPMRALDTSKKRSHFRHASVVQGSVVQGKDQTLPPAGPQSAVSRLSPPSCGEVVYRWHTPLPVVSSRVPGKKMAARVSEFRKPEAETKPSDSSGGEAASITTHIYLPRLPFATLEKSDTKAARLPQPAAAADRLPSIQATAAAPGLEDLVETAGDSGKNTITIPLQ